MKPLISGAVALLAAASLAGAQPAAEPAEGVTYVIPVKGMIERALVYVVRRGVSQAERAGAKAIVFDMDTPGGRLDATEEIIEIITGLRTPTYTFVNPNAISAGAITAMATDHIYMAPGGRIGDAMPIIMSPLPFGAPQEIPASLREKMVSPTVALIRSAAQRKGHDERLAEAMVRPEMEYRIGDTLISPAGQLLTLTSQDAEQIVGEGADRRPLLSEGTVADLHELLGRIGRSRDRVVVFEVTPAERVARVIEGFPLSGLLLAAGLLLLYVEFKTPGFGLPGISVLLLLGIWFWGHHVAGLAGMGEIVLFAFGAMLLAVEIFLIPGFGVTGIGGIVLMVVAVLMAMVEHPPAGPVYPPMRHVERAVEVFGLSMVVALACGVALTRFLPRTTAYGRLVLGSTLAADRGFSASRDTRALVGLSGRAITALRPAGIGEFGDQRLNVVSRGNFVEAGQPIVVAEAHGNRIVVEAAPPAAGGTGAT